MESYSEALIRLTQNAVENAGDKEFEKEFRNAIIQSLNSGAQEEIDRAIAHLSVHDATASTYLQSFLKWHISHQSQNLVDMGNYFVTQLVIPVTVTQNGMNLKTDISAMALRKMGKSLMSLLEMDDDGILMFAEEYQSINAFSLDHVTSFNLPKMMSTQNWPYFEKIKAEPGICTIFIYAMLLEPMKPNNLKGILFDGALNNPEATIDWQEEATSLIKSDFNVKKIDYSILEVGKPSTFSLGLLQYNAYERARKIVAYLEYREDGSPVFTDAEKEDFSLVINECPKTKNVGISVFSQGKSVFVADYGYSAIIDAEKDGEWLDKHLLKRKISEAGFLNILMESKEEESSDLSERLLKPSMRIV